MNRAFDLIQARYGFTDEYILSLPYCRFMDMVETIAKVKSEELQERYKLTAFGAYLQGAAGGENGESVPFNEYLINIGLEQDPQQLKVEKQEALALESSPDVTKEEALAKAQQILSGYTWGE